MIRVDTIKGKGFMENKVNWYGAVPNGKEFEIALSKIEKGI